MRVQTESHTFTASTMTKPMRACVKKAKLRKRVNVQGLRRSAEDILRRLGVAGAVAEAVMGHGRLTSSMEALPSVWRIKHLSFRGR